MKSAGRIGALAGPLASLRIAIVHDYLNQRGGAEKVVEVFSRMFPDAPVYTSIFDRRVMGEYWSDVDIRTSFMQRLRMTLGVAKTALPLYPVAFESFDLSGYDLVLSSSSTFAKGVITRPETCHVCYCYTPTRFLWMFHEYTGRQPLPPGARAVLPAMVTPLRIWDAMAAQRVDHFIGISQTVARRIEKYYRRPASVVEPPVDMTMYEVSTVQDDYFLVVARLLAYKRIDLAVEACSRLGRKLVVVGDGPDEARLRRLAGPSVRFTGRLPDIELRRLFGRCKAVLWPGEEDFGLVPVEAQASGRPVIAFNRGGAAETVIDGQTGSLFSEQTVECLIDAIEHFDPASYDPDRLRQNAGRYDLPVFIKRMSSELEAAYARHRHPSEGGSSHPQRKP